MADCLRDVAIIGAGLGGCALALALSAHNVPITIYESRSADADVLTSGVILTPNGLRILDRLGVLARIESQCYIATHRVFKTDDDRTVRKTLIASPLLYGYSNHRIWRKILLDAMKQMFTERSIRINYDSKFNGIVSDEPDGVTFLVDQRTHTASLLIGSDGIYSTLRKHIAPDIVPEYTGIVGILSHIKRASVEWPYEGYERNATIQGKPGAMFFMPEDPEAEDIMIGKQVQYPMQSREDMQRLQADHDKLLEFYTRDYSEWGSTARKIIDSVRESKDTLYIWPYLRMPKLKRWYSDTGRVILIGDGAHALPPSSGQGVNQALEDVYSLTMLLTYVADKRETVNNSGQLETNGDGGHDEMLHALSFWQEMRQKRIDAIFDWATNATNVERMPEAERKKLFAEGKIKETKLGQADDMSWLYKPDIEDEIKAWVGSRARE